jgi:tetratricopeptide (TPR) repeat protein
MRTIAVFVCLVWLAPASVHAQSEEDRREARREFAEGERAFARGESAIALGHFERAFALAPHDAVRFNLAICYERLGRVRDAVREYDAAARSEALDRRTRERAARLAREARRGLGVLVLEGPEGLRTTIDGEPACALPCSAEVDPGAHEVRVAEHERIERAEVRAGESVTVRFSLPEPAPPIETPAPIRARGPVPVAPEDPGRGPTWLTWSGTAIAALGVLGVAGFGAGAQLVHERCDPACDPDTAQTGDLMRDLTNASIAIAIGGALFVAIDLVVLAAQGNL